MSSDEILEFGHYPQKRTHQLLLDGQRPVQLGSRAFFILVALVESAGKIISKEDLVARVWPSAPPWLKAGLGPGLIGTFTTFSALIVSLLTLTHAGMPLLAVLYLLVSLVGGLLAAALGLRLGRSSSPVPRIEADQ